MLVPQWSVPRAQAEQAWLLKRKMGKGEKKWSYCLKKDDWKELMKETLSRDNWTLAAMHYLRTAGHC